MRMGVSKGSQLPMAIPKLPTVHGLAKASGRNYHNVMYAVKRLGITPSYYVGATGVFREQDASKILAFLEKMRGPRQPLSI
jgi:hypothetical protein